MMRTSLAFYVFTFIGLALSAQDPSKFTPAEEPEFKRPRPGHRTSRSVSNPWLGFGHDDHPAMRGATYLMKPEEIQALPRQGKKANNQEPLGFAKGSGLRIVGTGHSWMRPGYGTLPHIARAAGLEQHMQLNIRGGEAGGARMMWELENGILSSQGKPFPVCMAAITTGQWDVMMWGGYTNDRPEFYFGWIDFCLKHNPKMEFYRFNGWPQWADGFGKGDKEPSIENYREFATKRSRTVTTQLIAGINKRYPGKVHVLPTNEAMLLALEFYFQGKLPGIKGLNRKVDGKSPSIWSDGGHLGKGMNWLEGYVFYATLYKKSPELIKARPPEKVLAGELDKVFREIAWEAVVNYPLSGVTDKNGNGIGDEIESSKDK
jgi:hypothetical protein